MYEERLQALSAWAKDQLHGVILPWWCSDYIQDHELCEICRMEKQLILATSVYSIPGKRKLIAVCKNHLVKLIRKNRKYSFDQEGNLIIEGKSGS